MAEGQAVPRPQVFVVDSQAGYVPLPSVRTPRWTRLGQKSVLPLVGLALLGLLVEGCFIYKLYTRAEAVTSRSHAEASYAAPHLQHGREKPFAHLLGSSKSIGEDKVVQWEYNVSSSFTHLMVYRNGRLRVQEEGYYFLYSKVRLNSAEDCSLTQHKVMKQTKSYGNLIELMKSSSFHCYPSKNPSKVKPTLDPDAENLWDSFLGGIFHLRHQDEIFVLLEDRHKMRPGPTENFMGAFMISNLAEF